MYFPIGFVKIFINFRMSTHTHTHTHTQGYTLTYSLARKENKKRIHSIKKFRLGSDLKSHRFRIILNLDGGFFHPRMCPTCY